MDTCLDTLTRGVGFMWTEAIVYTVISAALGYLGWRSQPVKLNELSAPETIGQSKEAVS